MTSTKCCTCMGGVSRSGQTDYWSRAGRRKPASHCSAGAADAGGVNPVGLLGLHRIHPLVAEAPVDPVAHERQLHHLGGEGLDRLACRPSAECVAALIAGLRVRIEPNQVASFGVTRPAATMPGSLSATTRCSLRRLRTPSTIANTKTGTIQNR